MAHAIVIEAGGAIRPLEVPEEGLSTLQAAVGGMIEALRFSEHITCYVNEEGKYTCLDDDGNVEVNRIATSLMIGKLFPGDFIAGPMVIIGFDPSTGEHVDLDERVILGG